MNSPHARVLRGAARLDKHAPDWYLRVDLDRLDLQDVRHCVLGQVYGDFFRGIECTGLSIERWREVRHLGFDTRFAFFRRRLEAEWWAQIEFRRAADRILRETYFGVIQEEILP